MINSAIRDLDSTEIGSVAGGAWFIPLIIIGIKKGLAAGGAAKAFSAGLALGGTGAAVALATEEN